MVKDGVVMDTNKNDVSGSVYLSEFDLVRTLVIKAASETNLCLSIAEEKSVLIWWEISLKYNKIFPICRFTAFEL